MRWASTSAPLTFPRPPWRIDSTTASAELLDLEQIDGEVLEGVVALLHPLDQTLGAAIGLNGGLDDDVGGRQLLDRLAVARLDRRVEARRELASLGHRAKATPEATPATRAPPP